MGTHTGGMNECNRLSAGLRIRINLVVSSGSKMLNESVYAAADCFGNTNTSSWGIWFAVQSALGEKINTASSSVINWLYHCVFGSLLIAAFFIPLLFRTSVFTVTLTGWAQYFKQLTERAQYFKQLTASAILQTIDRASAILQTIDRASAILQTIDRVSAILQTIDRVSAMIKTTGRIRVLFKLLHFLYHIKLYHENMSTRGSCFLINN
jgi:hypothetical protein